MRCTIVHFNFDKLSVVWIIYSEYMEKWNFRIFLILIPLSVDFYDAYCVSFS